MFWVLGRKSILGGESGPVPEGSIYAGKCGAYPGLEEDSSRQRTRLPGGMIVPENAS